MQMLTEITEKSNFITLDCLGGRGGKTKMMINYNMTSRKFEYKSIEMGRDFDQENLKILLIDEECDKEYKEIEKVKDWLKDKYENSSRINFEIIDFFYLKLLCVKERQFRCKAYGIWSDRKLISNSDFFFIHCRLSGNYHIGKTSSFILSYLEIIDIKKKRKIYGKMWNQEKIFL